MLTAQTTTTQPAPGGGPMPIVTDEIKAFIRQRMAHHDLPSQIVAAVQANFHIEVDLGQVLACWRDRNTHPTPTGPIQDEEPMAILTDEIKEFIVRGLARYETPSQVAAAVKVQFGIEMTRYQVHEYNPAGSRPPAARWCELHAATRERFLNDLSMIGIAQKAYRLRMLDQFARRAIESNFPFHAAEFMVLAAKECGGFYDKQRAGAAAKDQPPKDTAP